MALLQIAEPGMSAAPHQHRLAIGIDLGTTNSLVATVRNGVSDVILDEQDRILLPSVVRYHADGTVEVGHEPRAKQSEDPSNTIVSVKRFMGRSLKDVSALSNAHYNFVDAPGMVRLNTVVGEKSPVEISAEILKVLKTRAESALGGELAGVVITVPAYFDDAQRQATKDAARLAGLTVLRLLNEPTAAAVAYGLDNGSEGVYAIYDLGGGTFDISILRLRQGVFEVLSTNGNSALGGDDFDECIYHWFLEQTGLKEMGPNDSRLLLSKARHAKEMLTDQPSAELSATLSTGQSVTATLTREIFTSLTKALVEKTLLSTRKALRDANLQADEIDGVVMVGGSTRMLNVRDAVKDFFGKELLTNLDPDKVVALGAAVQANILVGNRSADEMLLLDVIPLSLGIETMGGLVEKIIPRNSTIPIAMAQDFTTYKDGQSAMSIHVAQGERELVADCRSLAKFELRGIPPMVAGAARIRVTFQVDADGLLSVTAREQSTGVESNVAVKPSYGLSDEEITKMLSDSHQNAQDDMAARMLREQQIEAIRLLEATEAALAEDGDALLSPEQRGVIDKAMGELRQVVEGSDLPLLKKTTESLNQITTEFAALRMNNSVKKALTGFKLDDLEVETAAGSA